jgi:predicted nucleotidyltransferase
MEELTAFLRGRTVGGMEDGLASLVPALLQSSPVVAIVELCGSRASGTEGRYSDWDFRVSTQDFAALAPKLPRLVRDRLHHGHDDRVEAEEVDLRRIVVP